MRISFLLALLLQGAMIVALVEGLNVKFWPKRETGTIIEILKEKESQKTETPLPPTKGEWVDPTDVLTVPPPIVPIDVGPREGVIAAQPSSGPTGPYDRQAVGVMETHTTPPYPPAMLRIGAEGTVKLRLMIGEDGRVVDAVLVGSSGYSALDDAARAWVVRHWRYRPALRSGHATASQATVAIRFDLKTAR